MSNDFENQNTGEENNQNPYQPNGQQDYSNPYQANGQQDYTNPYQANGQQDYSNPYQTNGQQDYGNQYQQTYNNGQYSSYNGNPYTSYNNYNTYNNGNVPLDKKGQPMKNRFGMKLTFSILEIICCNLISLICGIISCVFTCKANTAYKEGRWEDFKSSAKTSMITLWIGLGGFILEVIVTIISIAVFGFSVATFTGAVLDDDYSYYDDEDDYNYYDDDEDSDDDDDSDEEDSEEDSEEEDSEEEDSEEDSEADSEAVVITPSNVTEGNGYTDFNIVFNGTAMTLPLTYGEFSAATGLSMDVTELNEMVSADDYDNYEITSVYDANGEEVCSIWLYNLTDSDLAMQDCYVAGVLAYNDGYSKTPDLVIQNGITFASTQDEIKLALGAPTHTYSSTTDDGTSYESWSWDSANPNADYFDEVEIEFIDGAVYKIEVDNITR